MKTVLKRDLNLIGKKRLSHVWHMTLDKNDRPFIITDGVVNVLPKLETKMHILKNAVEFANKIGISKPRVSVLSATEEILKSMPSSIDANLITQKAAIRKGGRLEQKSNHMYLKFKNRIIKLKHQVK